MVYKSIERRQEHEEILHLHSIHAWDCISYPALRPRLPDHDCTRDTYLGSRRRLLHYFGVSEGRWQGRQSSCSGAVQENRHLQDLRLDGNLLGMFHHVQMDTRVSRYPDSNCNHILVCAGEQYDSPEKVKETSYQG